jgi:hypothetical protein
MTTKNDFSKRPFKRVRTWIRLELSRFGDEAVRLTRIVG